MLYTTNHPQLQLPAVDGGGAGGAGDGGDGGETSAEATGNLAACFEAAQLAQMKPHPVHVALKDTDDNGGQSFNGSFDSLYRDIMEVVAAGHVTRWVDPTTSLEVFSHVKGAPTDVGPTLGANGVSVIAWCRGLVLHPPSQRVVTMPFVRFFEVGEEEAHKARDDAVGEVDGSLENDLERAHKNDLVQATLKVDGSLGIGFIWEGLLYVSTRRRLDSEQALWATSWARAHIANESLVAGHTYLFEIVCADNKHIVDYCFEGLVS
jgi:hypothetical protein